MRNHILVCLVGVMLLGCAVGPDYKRPPVEAPTRWRFDATEARDLANTPWWKHFQDPVLDQLIQIALEENKDLRVASARIEEFMGRYVTTRGNLFPQLGAGAGYTRQRVSQEGVSSIPSSQATFDTYDVFFNGSWEIDFFGRLTRATEAARAELLATEEARRVVILTLVSSVAATYIDLLTLDKQLDTARKTAEGRKQSLDIFQKRFEGGVVSEVVLSQSAAEYHDAVAKIPDLERSVVQTENALSLLLGRNPGPIVRGRRLDALAAPGVPSGLPSDLLERRPDIRQAEQALVAANARIGVAKSLYFPTIVLTGLFGSSSPELSDLFTGPMKIWSFTAPLTLPIFTAGRIKGQVQAAEAAQRQALYRYQAAIQNGFREVEDALVDRVKFEEQLQALGEQVQALRRYARLALLRYDEGYASYVEVLDAERSLFNAELTYAAVQGSRLNAFVNIYKAMGGGWVEAAEKSTPESKDSRPSGAPLGEPSPRP
uniref:Efflux transporter outer membrane subunit n=1 Tax=Desulfacinum infernum TaxID=35837 RepID=A0A832EJ77_9BACT